jgi:hypothetical protein
MGDGYNAFTTIISIHDLTYYRFVKIIQGAINSSSSDIADSFLSMLHLRTVTVDVFGCGKYKMR